MNDYYKRTRAEIIAAKNRARTARWTAPGRSVVEHPKYGKIIVPHTSNLGAVQNAAEKWGVNWLDIRDATVTMARPDQRAVAMPKMSYTLYI